MIMKSVKVNYLTVSRLGKHLVTVMTILRTELLERFSREVRSVKSKEISSKTAWERRCIPDRLWSPTL